MGLLEDRAIARLLRLSDEPSRPLAVKSAVMAGDLPIERHMLNSVLGTPQGDQKRVSLLAAYGCASSIH